MSLFKRLDGQELFREIRSIELSNENIDSKTSKDKLSFMRRLKEKIEDSGILENQSDSAHILIRSVYELLYTRQGNFPESYYATLSRVLSQAGSYNDLVHPYEQFLAEKMASLKDIANSACKTEEQHRMSSLLGQRAGILKTAALAIMLGLTAAGCNVKIEQEPIVFRTAIVDYEIQVRDMDHYIVKDGATVKQSELGKLLAIRTGSFTPTGGVEEITQMELYSFGIRVDKGPFVQLNNGWKEVNLDSPDIIAVRRPNGRIVYIMINTHAKYYAKIIEKLSRKLTHFDPKYKLNWGF